MLMEDIKNIDKRNYKMHRCEGHGQGVCKTCSEQGFGTGAWNWMTMLYRVDGYFGIYCYKHAKELEGKL